MRPQLFAAVLIAAGAANASAPSGFGLEVLVDGRERPEYAARGTVYVEALRGHDYALRLSNPTGTRVAVALSVDGLNTIDSRRTTARDARKWLLAPYETVIIPGWQISGTASRKFVFTTERGSYGAALGKTQNLGVIEAVFFRERLPYQQTPASSEGDARDHSKKSLSSSPSPSSMLSDEYAATGMGRTTEFGVTQVDLQLETEPAATVRLRYEFRPQLIALDVLPRDPDRSRVVRREGARGFEEFCPEVR